MIEVSFQGTSNDPFNEALQAAGAAKVRGAFNKYSRPGERHGGTVVNRELFQSRDPDDNTLETWDDGRPVMKAKIVVQTDERGEDNEDGTPDDGRRAIYVKWWGDDLKALKDAVGKNDLEVGGWFGAIFEREEAPTKKAFSGRKIYSYVYNPPAFVPQDAGPDAAAAQPQTVQAPAPATQPAAQPTAQPVAAFPQTNAGFAPPQAAQPAAPAPVAQPAPQPTAQAATAQVSPQEISDLIGKGHTDADIVSATGASPEAVSFVRSMFQPNQ